MLLEIAAHFDKVEAVSLFREASAAEDGGDFTGAIRLYKRAFHLWPALDSGSEGGVPTAVLELAEEAGVDCSGVLEMPMETAPQLNFDLEDREGWLQYLDVNGYCVIRDVADAEAILRAKSLLWDFLESVPDTEVTRGDPASWSRGWLPSAGNGLMGGYGIGQSDFCWHARQIPGVKQAFASIWECDNLLVSFDGGNVFRPWQGAHPEWRTGGGWWHVDQNFYVPEGRSSGSGHTSDARISVQGFITFTDASPTTGGLCVIPGSHKSFKQVCERSFAEKLPADFVPVLSSDPALRESGSRLVCAKAGSLILWDSRCVHCNTPGEVQESQPEAVADDALLRVVAYVCMTPAAWASEEVLAKRKDAFLHNVTTSHWPHFVRGYDEAPTAIAHKEWDDANATQRSMIIGALGEC